MINHFRTLLLNESSSSLADAGLTSRGLHVDPSYIKKTLPSELQTVYGLLFPIDTPAAKAPLVHAYMTLIKAVGLEKAALSLDPRITYNLPLDDDYFHTRGVSVAVPYSVTANDSRFGVDIYGYEYQLPSNDTVYEKKLMIMQSGANISVADVTSTPVIWLPSTALTFTSHFSQTITLRNPGISTNTVFNFVVRADVSFTTTTGKSWLVNMSVPISGLINNINAQVINQTAAIQKMQGLPASPDATNYDNLWKQHFNSNYQLAGLLIGLVFRMNAL